jgi:hypothetical protein
VLLKHELCRISAFSAYCGISGLHYLRLKIALARMGRGSGPTELMQPQDGVQSRPIHRSVIMSVII